MQILIVDDESSARDQLRRALQQFSWVRVAGEACSVEEAHERIQILQPDLMLSDIELNGVCTLDWLQRLDEAPDVIFTASHDRLAARAFELHALDYLVKPVPVERLETALHRVTHGNRRSQSLVSESYLSRILVRESGFWRLVPVKDIRSFRSEGNYVHLWWEERTATIQSTLRALDQHLDPKTFLRANARQIINLDFVSSFKMLPRRGMYALLADTEEVLISAGQAGLIRARNGV